MSAKVLVVDDKPDMASAIADGLADAGYEAIALSDPQEALARIEEGTHDALVTDLRMPVHDGFELLTASRTAAPESPVIIMTAFSAIDSAVDAIRRGAYHYLTKPFSVNELSIFLGRALFEVRLRRESRAVRRSVSEGLNALVGTTPRMRELADLVARVADADVPVLVLGETGTGKGLVARAIHAESRRADRLFVSVNCAAMPETLLESELFGHVKGAFPGALSSRRGLFETADGGTLFLDEIAEMSPGLQARLLTVLETGRFRAAGDTRERSSDVRLVTATHRDLRAAILEHHFREDLLLRLNVVSLEVPALRDRRSDVPLLVEHFLKQALQRRPTSTVRRFSPQAMQALLEYPWPGNVRELERLVERAVVLGQHESVSKDELVAHLVDPRLATVSLQFGGPVLHLRELQRHYAAWALTQHGGRRRETSEALDVDLDTLDQLIPSDDETSTKPLAVEQ